MNRTDIDRKIRALEARAASSPFEAERESCRRVAAKLREKGRGAVDDRNLRSIGPEIDGIDLGSGIVMDGLAWVRTALRAQPCPSDWCGGTDMWVVPGHGPPVDDRGLVELALARKLTPNCPNLTAAIIRAMGWRA